MVPSPLSSAQHFAICSKCNLSGRRGLGEKIDSWDLKTVYSEILLIQKLHLGSSPSSCELQSHSVWLALLRLFTFCFNSVLFMLFFFSFVSQFSLLFNIRMEFLEFNLNSAKNTRVQQKLHEACTFVLLFNFYAFVFLLFAFCEWPKVTTTVEIATAHTRSSSAHCKYIANMLIYIYEYISAMACVWASLAFDNDCTTIHTRHSKGCTAHTNIPILCSSW